MLASVCYTLRVTQILSLSKAATAPEISSSVVSMVKRLLGIVCRERQQYKALAFPFFLTINKQAQAD